jgi:fatty-acyl-CoA synthase
LGLDAGERIAVLAKNSIEYVLLYYAASMAGVVPVPLNYRSAPPEWLHAIGDSGAALVIADAAHRAALDALRRDMPSVGLFATLDDGEAPGWVSPPRVAEREAATAPIRAVSADDDVYQLYSSGTTGRPKGAVLTHGAVTANCAQIAALPHRGRPGERSLVAAPLCHAGAVWSALAPQHWGASLAILPAVDASELVRTLDEDGIGYAALVPSILHMCLIDVPDFAVRRYRDLRLVHTGSVSRGSPHRGRRAEAAAGQRVRANRRERRPDRRPPVRRLPGLSGTGRGQHPLARPHRAEEAKHRLIPRIGCPWLSSPPWTPDPGDRQ